MSDPARDPVQEIIAIFEVALAAAKRVEADLCQYAAALDEVIMDLEAESDTALEGGNCGEEEEP